MRGESCYLALLATGYFTLMHIINTTKPTEIYNLGAQSHVKVVFTIITMTAELSDADNDDNLGNYEDNDDGMARIQSKSKTRQI